MDLMLRRNIMMAQGGGSGSPFIAYPSSYSTSGTVTNAENAYTPHTSDTYATFTGESCRWFFNVVLPENITITSASCFIRLKNSSSGRWARMFAGGDSPKNSQSTGTALSTVEFDLSSWTREELLQCCFTIRHDSGDILLYGATLTIEYELN